jgi:hypothetical protein
MMVALVTEAVATSATTMAASASGSSSSSKKVAEDSRVQYMRTETIGTRGS